MKENHLLSLVIFIFQQRISLRRKCVCERFFSDLTTNRFRMKCHRNEVQILIGVNRVFLQYAFTFVKGIYAIVWCTYHVCSGFALRVTWWFFIFGWNEKCAFHWNHQHLHSICISNQSYTHTRTHSHSRSIITFNNPRIFRWILFHNLICSEQTRMTISK